MNSLVAYCLPFARVLGDESLAAVLAALEPEELDATLTEIANLSWAEPPNGALYWTPEMLAQFPTDGTAHEIPEWFLRRMGRWSKNSCEPRSDS